MPIKWNPDLNRWEQHYVGAGLTVDNGTDPPTEVTTLVAPGATISGDEATLATEQVVLSRTTTLTNDQIKALPTTFIEVVPAPEAGKSLVFLGGTVLVNRSGGAWTNLDGGFVWLLQSDSWFDVSNKFSDFNLNNREGTLSPAVLEEDAAEKPSSVSHAAGEGISIAMTNSLGDLTGGHPTNTMKVTVIYTIVDL